MKFDFGQWRLLPGTEAVYPTTFVDVRTEQDALTVVVYDHTIRGRWDYLEGTTITFRFTSPMPNVIRVQMKHFKGRQLRLPDFDLDYSPNNAAPEIGQDEKHAWLKAGDLA